MSLPVKPLRLTKASYLQKLHSGTEAYKNARDKIETIFNESEGLPDVAHTPIAVRLKKSMSPEENLKKKRELYQWDRSDGALRLLQVSDVDGNIWEFFSSDFDEESKVTMESIRERYVDLSQEFRLLPDIYTAQNIGLREDWYTDAVFAQQSFTGVNPIGIRLASSVKSHDWLMEFKQAAADQKNDAFLSLLSNTPKDQFYVVDNSDYRDIVGLAGEPDAIIVSGPNDGGDTENPLNSATGAPPIWGAASVTLYSLSNSGTLHPVAICLDYRGPLAQSVDAHGHTIPSKSVTIFNRKVTPTTPGVDESTDWPWRYAKMTASMSDWSRHELTSHLTETHLVEEATIIAAQRNLPDGHIVWELLHPHWYKTLSLNVMARSTLVPDYIKPIAPLPLDKVMQFINQTYLDFDFVGRYVPNDLASRGFPLDSLDSPKMHNYLYARGVAQTWSVLRGFVSDVLKSAYPNGDTDVQADTYITNFCNEMQTGAAYAAATVSMPNPAPKKEGWWDTIKKDVEGIVHTVEDGIEKVVQDVEGNTNFNKPFDLGPSQPPLGGALASFPPPPQTLDELIDMVTMCIHIAVPQHNAVNYLQQFYLSFLPNRPAAFAAPLPSSLPELQGYGEGHLVASLPLAKEANRKQWMGMAQVPYLLSAEVDEDASIVQYAQDVKKSKNGHVQRAADAFARAVDGLKGKFDGFNKQMDDQGTLYHVLDPKEMALSILI